MMYYVNNRLVPNLMATKITTRIISIHIKGSDEKMKRLVFSTKKNNTITQAIRDKKPVILPKPGIELKGTFLLIKNKVMTILTIGKTSIRMFML